MTSLPPELAQLDLQYQQLTDAVAAGHVTVTSAMSSLEAMMAIDVYGGIWRIDADGDFTRAEGHGAPAAKTDPSNWPAAHLQSEIPAPTPTQPGFVQPPVASPLVQPPVAEGANPLFTPPQPTAPPAWALGLDQHSRSTAAPGGYEDASGFETPKSLSSDAPQPKSRGRRSKEDKAPKEPQAPKAPRSYRPKSGLLAALAGRRKVVILAVVGVALLALAWWQTRSHEPAGQSLPATSDTSTGSFTPDSPAQPEPATEQSDSQAPSIDDALAALGAFTSSVQDGASVTANSSDGISMARTRVLAVATQSGDFAWDAQSPRKGKNGTWTQDVALVDGQTQAPLFSATLAWKREGGQWVLASAPKFK